MVPQSKAILENEHQERVAAVGESEWGLTAEQVYAQRLAETPFNGALAAPTFIP
ncbi:MAG: hypothetical protein NT121_09080 [Chloroflexi bacterium]|nr:hypothetical protein [Chloroflexota bacterium]